MSDVFLRVVLNVSDKTKLRKAKAIQQVILDCFQLYMDIVILVCDWAYYSNTLYWYLLAIVLMNTLIREAIFLKHITHHKKNSIVYSTLGLFGFGSGVVLYRIWPMIDHNKQFRKFWKISAIKAQCAFIPSLALKIYSITTIDVSNESYNGKEWIKLFSILISLLLAPISVVTLQYWNDKIAHVLTAFKYKPFIFYATFYCMIILDLLLRCAILGLLQSASCDNRCYRLLNESENENGNGDHDNQNGAHMSWSSNLLYVSILFYFFWWRFAHYQELLFTEFVDSTTNTSTSTTATKAVTHNVDVNNVNTLNVNHNHNHNDHMNNGSDSHHLQCCDFDIKLFEKCDECFAKNRPALICCQCLTILYSLAMPTAVIFMETFHTSNYATAVIIAGYIAQILYFMDFFADYHTYSTDDRNSMWPNVDFPLEKSIIRSWKIVIILSLILYLLLLIIFFFAGTKIDVAQNKDEYATTDQETEGGIHTNVSSDEQRKQIELNVMQNRTLKNSNSNQKALYLSGGQKMILSTINLKDNNNHNNTDNNNSSSMQKQTVQLQVSAEDNTGIKVETVDDGEQAGGKKGSKRFNINKYRRQGFQNLEVNVESEDESSSSDADADEDEDQSESASASESVVVDHNNNNNNDNAGNNHNSNNNGNNNNNIRQNRNGHHRLLSDQSVSEVQPNYYSPQQSQVNDGDGSSIR